MWSVIVLKSITGELGAMVKNQNVGSHEKEVKGDFSPLTLTVSVALTFLRPYHSIVSCSHAFIMPIFFY